MSTDLPKAVSAAPTADCPASAMTLRDWFAGQVLTGLIPAPKQPGVPSLNIEGMAKAAYDYADAMMKRRDMRSGS